jgi:hypothetical protein
MGFALSWIATQQRYTIGDNVGTTARYGLNVALEELALGVTEGFTTTITFRLAC